MSRDLQMRVMATRTHDGYLREVRKLAAWFNTAPDLLSQHQVGQYLLHLIHDCNFAPGVAPRGLQRHPVRFYRACYWLKMQAPPPVPAKPPVRCRECGGEMQLTAITDGSSKVIYRRPLANHALVYLDSG